MLIRYLHVLMGILRDVIRYSQPEIPRRKRFDLGKQVSPSPSPSLIIPVGVSSLHHVLPPPNALQRQLRAPALEQGPAPGERERGGGGPGAQRPAGDPHPLHPGATRPLPVADAGDVMDGLHPLPIQEEVMCSGAAALQHSEDKSPEELKFHLGGGFGEGGSLDQTC